MIFEIRVQGFFTSEGGVTVAPSAAVTVEVAQIEGLGRRLLELSRGVAELVEGMPLKGVRPMSKEEVQEYLKDEREQEDASAESVEDALAKLSTEREE